MTRNLKHLGPALAAALALSAMAATKGCKMARKSKVLGLAFVAALVLSAVMASAAAGEEGFTLTSSASHTSLGGSQVGTDVFTADAGTVSCETVTYSGTLTEEEEILELPLTPHYTNCETQPIGSATVTMESCGYVLTPLTSEESTNHALVGIACEAGDSITVVAKVVGTTKCTIHIPPQIIGGATVTEASGGDLTVDFDLEDIHYNQTAGTGFGACSTAENTTNGTYEGHATINGGEAALGMQVAKPVISVPAEVAFKLNQKNSIPIENISDPAVDIEIKKFSISQSGYFKFIKDDCGVKLKKGATCKAEYECIKAVPAEVEVLFTAESKAPRDLDSAELKCS